jgi:enterochelin esterase-like enzyme
MWLIALAAVSCTGNVGGNGVAHAQGLYQVEAPAQRVPPSPTVVGDLRVHRFVSGVFANVRSLRVLVPDGYDRPENATRRYPVLYLDDGQNLFDATTSPAHAEWKVDETVRALTAAGKIPPMIVVGIDNAGPALRAHELLPYPFTYPPQDLAPIGRRYPDFLVREVVPFINDHYRTLTDPSHTALGGSSLAGLSTAYVIMARPGVFGRVLIESPSLYVDHEHIFHDAAYVKEWPERVYLGIGTSETGRGRCSSAEHPDMLVGEVQRFAAMLRDDGVDSSRVHVEIAPCAHHDEDAWAARLPTALTFLFGSDDGKK